MASITKVMTAVVALDSDVELDDKVKLVNTKFQDDAQLVGFEKGDTATMRELLLATLVFSGNDAAKNVAIAVAGSEKAFAKLMNEKVEELGLEHTHFVNSHGLQDEGHYSSTHDLCLIGRYALDNYPFIREAVMTGTTEVTVGGTKITLWSSDTLMGNYEGLRGIKTGRVETGLGFLGSARRNGVTLYSCVLGCETSEGRFDDTATLLDWGFSRFGQVTLARSSWTTRQLGWTDAFWLGCAISPQQDVVAYVDGEPLRVEGMQQLPSLVSADVVLGAGAMDQGERSVGGLAFGSGGVTKGMSAWSAVALPVMP